MQTPIESDIGFVDSVIQSYTRTGTTLQVSLKAWNRERVDVTFDGVVGVRDLDAGDTSELCERHEETDFVRACLKREYEEVPSDHGLRLFQFLDNDDVPALEVVARSVLVSRTGS